MAAYHGEEAPLRILVVEDEPRMAKLLRQGLLHVTLPGMDGFTIARRLRTGHNQVPILMLTARDGPPRADSAAAAFPGRGLEHEPRHAGRPARQAANRLGADGGMMGKVSIRLRLTIWYSVMLLLGLALFGVGMWFAPEQRLIAGVDSRLTQRVQGLQTVFSTEGGTKDRRQLQEEVSEFAGEMPDGVLIQLRDAAGTLVLPSPNQPPFPSRPASNQPASWTADRDGRSFRIRTVRMDYGGRPYDVLLAGPLDEVRAVMRAFRNLLLLMIPGVLAAACLGGYWISRRALAPVNEITRVAKSISVQNLSERLSVPRTGDEFQRMSETWNEVLLPGLRQRGRDTQAAADPHRQRPQAHIWRRDGNGIEHGARWRGRTVGSRYGRGHRGGRAGAHLRALLSRRDHSRQRLRPRAVHRPGHRPGARVRYRRRERARRGGAIFPQFEILTKGKAVAYEAGIDKAGKASEVAVKADGAKYTE